MSNFFGPQQAKLGDLEKRVVSGIASSENILYPRFVDNDILMTTTSMPEEITRHGVYAPFDFINVPPRIKDFIAGESSEEDDFFTNDEKKKFVARPDMFHIRFEGGKAKISPVDVKGENDEPNVSQMGIFNTAMLSDPSKLPEETIRLIKEIYGAKVVIEDGEARFEPPIEIEEKDNRPNISQLSMYNTAMLFYHSRYMQEIVRYVREKYNVEVVFENGTYLSENDSSKQQQLLESYFARYHLGLVKGAHEFDTQQLGLEFDGLKPSLVQRRRKRENKFESLFEGMHFSTISEIQLGLHFGFIKNRIGKDTIYPNRICSINGFNGGNKPIHRLRYYPNSHIKTFDPMISILTQSLEEICQVRDIGEFLRREQSQKGETFEDTFLRRKKLDYELAKIRLIRFLDDSWESGYYEKEGDKSDNVLNRYHHHKEHLEKQIELARKNFIDARMIMRYRNKRKHNKFPPEGSKEWNSISAKIRQKIIEERMREIEKLNRNLSWWEEGDMRNTSRIGAFNYRCRDHFTFGDDVGLPTELYLQLRDGEVARVLLYNSKVIE